MGLSEEELIFKLKFSPDKFWSQPLCPTAIICWTQIYEVFLVNFFLHSISASLEVSDPETAIQKSTTCTTTNIHKLF